MIAQQSALRLITQLYIIPTKSVTLNAIMFACRQLLDVRGTGKLGRDWLSIRVEGVLGNFPMSTVSATSWLVGPWKRLLTRD